MFSNKRWCVISFLALALIKRVEPIIPTNSSLILQVDVIRYDSSESQQQELFMLLPAKSQRSGMLLVVTKWHLEEEGNVDYNNDNQISYMNKQG